MRISKYKQAFNRLSKKGVFSSAEGRAAGIPSRMIAYFCSKGEIERISKGTYKIKNLDFKSEFEWEDLALTTLTIPNGVICLISALSYYGLTEEIMREFWIAIPHDTTSPKRDHARIIRMRNISFGQTTVKMGQLVLKIFDRERTIVDTFRYLDREIALKTLQAYLKPNQNRKPDIDKLLKYAKKFRVDLTSYIAALTL
ncbi:MAG TPA: type IV toxin-antitoxin system AbiEi family antitoxin domain-containing protein [Rhabdochlamydiaceae bacterium]|nr:type IV toxin-antitoxin system AbiEi family antitoxin domain-containing protein [Rhabdochlamydiaceae bacterium]